MSSETILEPHITAAEARSVVDAYVTKTLGPEYGIGHSELRDGQWCFMVIYHHNEVRRTFAVGVIAVDGGTGQINALTDEQLRDMREAGLVQAAQVRRKLARTEDGYIMRYQARILASAWISDRVDLKVGANGGVFLPLTPPVWRFSISFKHLEPLGVIDVDAQTGQVAPLTNKQLQTIGGRHHAVVVIGFDEQRVFVNDPAQPEEPLEVDIDTFLLAWSRRNYQYAVLRLQQAP